MRSLRGSRRSDKQTWTRRRPARTQRMALRETDGGRKTMAVRELDTQVKETPGVLHKKLPRRAFLLKLGFVLNGIAGVMVGVPVLGYLFSSFRTTGPFTSWIPLGPIGSF